MLTVLITTESGWNLHTVYIKMGDTSACIHVCFLARPHNTRGPSREGNGHEGREYPFLNGVLFLCCKEGVCQWQPFLWRIASSLYRLTDSGVQGGDGEWLVREQATTSLEPHSN